MSAALWIALKDLRLLVRDRVALFWVLGFPLLFAGFLATVLSATLSAERPLQRLLWVDEDRGPAAAALAAALDRRGGFERVPATLGAARDRVRRGDDGLYLRLPARLSAPASASGAGAALELGHDPTRVADVAALEAALGAAAAPGAPPAFVVERRAAVRLPPGRRVVELAFPAAILWGLMGCAASFAVSLVVERREGTLVRLVTAPVPRSSVLGGKALACAAACLADSLLLVLGAVALAGLAVPSVALLAVAVLATTVAFVGITVLLGATGTTEQAVAGAGWASLLLMAMLGGAMVPVSAMPTWLHDASVLSPVRWGILALEGALFRDFSARELAGPCAILVGVGVVCFVLGQHLLARADARG